MSPLDLRECCTCPRGVRARGGGDTAPSTWLVQHASYVLAAVAMRCTHYERVGRLRIHKENGAYSFGWGGGEMGNVIRMGLQQCQGKVTRQTLPLCTHAILRHT